MVRAESREAAARALQTKAGIGDVFLGQLYRFGMSRRDPRGRVVTVAYYALVPAGRFATAVARAAGTTGATLDVPWTGERGGPVDASTPPAPASRSPSTTRGSSGSPSSASAAS